MNRPNILVIMADQFRHDYLGCIPGSPARTPHLDALAAGGRLFTQCATNAPVCAPARIALATGLHGDHTGCLDNSAYCPAGRTTYYQRLRDAGYRVGAVGKLDLAKPDPTNGLDGQRPDAYRWGFTHPLECEGKMHAGFCRPPSGPYSQFLHQQGLLDRFCDDYAERRRQGFAIACADSPLPTEAFEDHWIGQQAVRWLAERPTDFPWHLFVSFVGPHDPFDPPTAYAEGWRDAPMPPAIPCSGTWRHPSMVAKQAQLPSDALLVERIRRQYCAAIELIDDQVGAILAALDQRGERDNTSIVFTSDHGEMLGDLGLYAKSVPYEAALRVPLIVAGPDVAPGQSDALIELADLNPTCCAWAGLPPQPDIDARDFGACCRGEADEHRSEQYSVLQSLRLVRTRTAKLVSWRSGGTELYDLEADPQENDNRAEHSPELLKELTATLHRRCTGERAFRF